MISIVQNRDCMEAMAEFPDKFFDLAVVDPPYGIGASEMTMGSGKNKKYKKGKKWDNETPSPEYWSELFRVSKNQIVWGGNYFELPPTKSWIFWDKGINGDCDFADGELAWTSYNKVLRIAPIRYKGFLGADADRFHPTQKPIKLYSWIYRHYLPQGGKVLDTHLGSGSNRIAAHKAGNIDFWGYELDEDYYIAEEQRFSHYIAQTNLFNTEETITEQLCLS